MWWACNKRASFKGGMNLAEPELANGRSFSEGTTPAHQEQQRAPRAHWSHRPIKRIDKRLSGFSASADSLPFTTSHERGTASPRAAPPPPSLKGLGQRERPKQPHFLVHPA